MLWPWSPVASAEICNFSHVPIGTFPLVHFNALDWLLMPTSRGGAIPGCTLLLCCHIPRGTFVFFFYCISGVTSCLKGTNCTTSTYVHFIRITFLMPAIYLLSSILICSVQNRVACFVSVSFVFSYSLASSPNCYY